MRWALVIDDPEEALGKDAARVAKTVETLLRVKTLETYAKGARLRVTACVDWGGGDISIHDKEAGCPQE